MILKKLIKNEKKSEPNKELKSNNMEEIIKWNFNIKNKQIDKKNNKISDFIY